MFKFVVFFALAAVCSAAPSPGFLHGGYVLPAATSYASRVDIHSAPIIKTIAAPVVTKTIVEAPVLTKTIVPVVGLHSAPLVSSYGYGLGHGLGHGYGLGYGYGHLGYGHY